MLQSARPSSGSIRIAGDGYGNPFRGIVDRCECAALCRVERGKCWDQLCIRHASPNPARAAFSIKVQGGRMSAKYRVEVEE